MGEFTMPIMPSGRMLRPGERYAEFTWEPTANQHQQSRSNHGQTLTRLKERGGVTWCELAAILECRRYKALPEADAKAACEALTARLDQGGK